jgi:hypothetical protein
MSIQATVIKLKSLASHSYTRSVTLIGIILAVAGPFLILTLGGREANNLPWYVWMILSLLLFTVVGAGFLAFKRTSHAAEDISISPDRKPEV